MIQKHNSLFQRDKLSWDMILFFLLYVISPSYFAIEVSSKLPLITFSRILIIMMFLMLVIRYSSGFKALHRDGALRLDFGLTGDKFLRRGLLTYFTLLLISDIVLLPVDPSEALKAAAIVIMESYMLVWILTQMLDTRDKLVSALSLLVFASGLTAIIAIVGCIFNCNPFRYMNLAHRDELLPPYYYRLGMIRAEAGFYHPVYYGAFCAIMAPINMYFIDHSKTHLGKILYSGCLSMNIVGMVLANSRGSMVAFACMLFIAIAVNIYKKQFRAFFFTYLPVALGATVILMMISLIFSGDLAFLKGIINSLINAVIPGFSTDFDVVSYGENADGMHSRIVQLTGILWTLSHNPLFGLGSNAHVRGLVCFRWEPGCWLKTDTFDMAIVAIICQYGIVGLLGYMALYGSIIKTIVSKRYRNDSLLHYLALSFFTYLLCLITIAELHKMAWVLIAAIICLINLEEKN